MTDEEMRARPLTLACLKAAQKSAHAFWRMDLRDDCGPEVLVVARSNGTIEITCAKCHQLLGCLRLADHPPPAGPPKDPP